MRILAGLCLALVVTLAQAAGAVAEPRIVWHVENHFRFFLDPADLHQHVPPQHGARAFADHHRVAHQVDRNLARQFGIELHDAARHIFRFEMLPRHLKPLHRRLLYPN